jgi:hypothetical protein
MTDKGILRRENRDWTELKGVVAALWLAAVLVFLAVHYSVPRDQDIVLDAKVTPVKLAGSAKP